MNVYIYEVDTMRLVEIACQDTIERVYAGYDQEMYAYTYTPAFGAIDGVKLPKIKGRN